MVRLLAMSENAPSHIIFHLDWPTRIRFGLGLAAALLVFGSIGFSVLQPWDPYGAISLLLADHAFFTVLRATALMVAVAVLGTIIIDSRLPQFGTFAACVGLCLPVVKTGGMDYLMVRLQAGREFESPADLRLMWVSLTLEMLAWVVAMAVMVAGSATAERWLKGDRNGEGGSANVKGKHKEKQSDTLKGLLATVLTAAIAAILIGLFCQSRQKGQVIFAVSAAFLLGALAADQITENRNVLWHVAAVPVVALGAYLFTCLHPERPAGLEGIVFLAPNRLAAVLPIEYLCAALPGAIFGFWTSEKVRFGRAHSTGEGQ